MTTISFHKRRAKVIGPLGYCMYGPDHSRDELSREHVIPRALGGGLVVLAGSCEDCRKKTHKFETECLARNWKMFRTEHNLEVSGLGHSPTHGTLTVREGRYLVPLIVPLREYPVVLTMPKIFDAPGLFTGSTRPSKWAYVNLYDPQDALARARKHLPAVTGITARYNVFAVFQLLAKIAHGIMVVHFEMDDIEPLLLDIILNEKTDDAWRVIGGGAPISMVSRRLPPIGIGQHFIRCDVLIHRGKFYVVVDICLFPVLPRALLAAPTYRLLAGVATQPPKKRAS